ncbi:hypothetical protein ACIRD3_00790 [Kitasatospora sp. NPDC093550]|uniref:hypothetical protein n=1 Tax=Kitasatospora sp. NPDC093550 TaxID=3364089 RepID=UPI0038056D69
MAGGAEGGAAAGDRGRPTGAGLGVLDGSPEHDADPLVRHWARRVEAADPVRGG